MQNKDDCISRQAVLDMAYAYGNGLEPEGYCVDVEDIQALPPAEPERKRGHWIEADDSDNRISGRCSVCGWESHLYEDDVVGMDFCPNCGADMRGVQNERSNQ